MQLTLMKHSVCVCIRRQDKSAMLYGVDAEVLLLHYVNTLCNTIRVLSKGYNKSGLAGPPIKGFLT